MTCGHPAGVTERYVTEYEHGDPLCGMSGPTVCAVGVPLLFVLPRAKDQMWFLYDYGDWCLFRLRVRPVTPQDAGRDRVSSPFRAGFHRVREAAGMVAFVPRRESSGN